MNTPKSLSQALSAKELCNLSRSAVKLHTRPVYERYNNRAQLSLCALTIARL